MKKSILTLLSIVLLISCSNNKKEIHSSTKVENGDFESKLNFWYGKGFKHTNEISYQGDYSLLFFLQNPPNTPFINAELSGSSNFLSSSTTSFIETFTGISSIYLIS